MTLVTMYSFYTDFVPIEGQNITTQTYMQQRLRDMLVAEQLTKHQIPEFPMTQSQFTINLQKFDNVSRQFPLLNMIFVFNSCGKCLVMCNGTSKMYKSKEDAYRAGYSIQDNQIICEHLVR